ncbi:hypothetical protein [Micromonospora endophytica]|uniref:Uncharacterized protein n=1 Tax=Micromonospora endophytica TaxID=515350 RepID=A0A2W2CZV0_9ACTN|nr:hypothetical protein [Micromonospora endophytica]PZF97038.1 hypothetical protein C1I93_12945 [Micromonospora endophytica]RIW40500.1 hypothetical protein D3H59_29260 [Micromonospora endophytica]BCJ58929.1 hypothetical protein Jiend_23510 [Micromonospora endophytica]
MQNESGRWVIHLPISVPDLVRARIFARTAARVLARLSARVEPAGVTVSAEDEQCVRHWVFCDRSLPGGGRCVLAAEHSAPCSARVQRLNRRAF